MIEMTDKPQSFDEKYPLHYIQIKTTFSNDLEPERKIAYLVKPIKCHWCNKKTKIISMAMYKQNKGICIDCLMTTF